MVPNFTMNNSANTTMRKFSLALLFILLATVLASSANVTLGVTHTDNADLSIYTTGSFTPVLDDLLVTFVYGRITLTRPGTMTDSESGTWTNIVAEDSTASTETMYMYVRDSLAPNTSMTVTVDFTGDSALAVNIQVLRISGVTRTGADAILQTAFQSSQTGGGTPAPAFASNALTENATIGCVFNRSSPAGMTPPSSWVERGDIGISGPTTGTESVSRDSGFTGTTITWGSTSATAFGSIIVELDTSTTAAPRRRVIHID